MPRARGDTIVLRGTVSSGTNSIEGVVAKIRFPAVPTGRPAMLLRPENHKIADSIVHWYKGRFEARRPKAVDGSGEERVSVDPVYFLGSSTRMWSHDVSESIVRCDPVGLLRTLRADVGTQAEQTQLTFHLTPNPHLAAASISEASFDGSCNVKRVRQATVQLTANVDLIFDQHYRWSSNKGGRTTRTGFQVAIGCVPFDAHDPSTVAEQILPALDDFLVLTSLASSHRVTCTGWHTSDASARFTQYYRGGMRRPTRASHALDMGLIPLHAFQQFVTEVWPRFRASPYFESLKTLSFAVVPGRRSTLEREFIGLFTALEEVVLCFRRQHDLVNVLPKDRWAMVERKVKNAIRATDLSKEERRGLYDNLSALNRVALRRAFDRFIEKTVDLNLTDLWPVFSKDGNGLLEIRNRIVHGDLDATRRVGALVVATDHLRWTLERIALSLLGWSIQASEVRPSLLAAQAPSITRLRDAMREMRSVP